MERREACKVVHLITTREHPNQDDSNIIKQITEVHRAILFSMLWNVVGKFLRVRSFVA